MFTAHRVGYTPYPTEHSVPSHYLVVWDSTLSLNSHFVNNAQLRATIRGGNRDFFTDSYGTYTKMRGTYGLIRIFVRHTQTHTHEATRLLIIMV